MTRCTCVLLVLLRLAIGWHLLYEGYTKLHNKTWTAETYLRESSGPLAPIFRDMAGDSLAARLDPNGSLAEVDGGKVDPADYFPVALEKEWDAWFDAFVDQYKLSDDQKTAATSIFKENKRNFVRWLRSYVTDIKKTSPTGAEPAVRKMTVAERLDEYERKLNDAREYLDGDYRNKVGSLWENEAKAELALRRAEYGKLRADLAADLERQSQKMRTEVATVVTTDQWEKHGPLKEKMKPGLSRWTFLNWIDFLVPWGLVVAGGLLMFGLLTRIACIGGAVLLLSFYLAMPPLPGLPDNPMAEGSYLVINKTLIEIIALLALACTRVGQWGGLDGLLRYCCCKRKQNPAGPTTAV